MKPSIAAPSDESRERFEKWAKSLTNDELCPCEFCMTVTYLIVWQAAEQQVLERLQLAERIRARELRESLKPILAGMHEKVSKQIRDPFWPDPCHPECLACKAERVLAQGEPR